MSAPGGVTGPLVEKNTVHNACLFRDQTLILIIHFVEFIVVIHLSIIYFYQIIISATYIELQMYSFSMVYGKFHSLKVTLVVRLQFFDGEELF